MVIDSMYEGGIRKALKKHGVHPQAFYDALSEYPLLDEQYARAQMSQAENFAEEIIEIADTEENPQKARNQIDARKWFASKVKPNKFGDRIDLNINQTVDLKGALTDARSRVREVLDISPKLVTNSTGPVPVAENKEGPQSFEELLGIDQDSEK